MSSKVRLKDLLREKDAFLTTTERIYNFYLTHTTGVILCGLAIVVLALAVAAGLAIAGSRAEKASQEYYLAYDASDPEKTLAGMEEIRRRHGDGKAGRLAAFAMADAYVKLGRYPEARELADRLASDLRPPERHLAPIIYNYQGALAEQTGDLEAALAHYEHAWMAVEAPLTGPNGRAVDDPVFFQTSAPFRMEILNARARVALALGRTEVARLAYAELENRFPGTPRAYAAGYRLDEILSAEASVAPSVAPDAPSGIVTEDLPPAGDSSGTSSGDIPPAGDSAPSAGDGEASGGAAGDGSGPPASDGGSGDGAAPGDSGGGDAGDGGDEGDVRDGSDDEGDARDGSDDEGDESGESDARDGSDDEGDEGDARGGSGDVAAGDDEASVASSGPADEPGARNQNSRTSSSRRAR
ncbi:MAG: hypothetical protein LBQ79_09160 [Deltaproteobacteria bacterium]|jgi:hypothetical protein|nr:hypothetical protein [Deltaproteobacteria bacterium]